MNLIFSAHSHLHRHIKLIFEAITTLKGTGKLERELSLFLKLTDQI